jgi:copper chaperone CopZ
MDATCAHMGPLLDRFADGESGAEESLRVREHTAACASCRDSLRNFAELNRRIAESPGPPVPANLEARIRSALDRAGNAGRMRRLIPAAAAAILVVAAGLLLLPSQAGAQIPAFVTSSAAVHENYLSKPGVMELKDSPDALRDSFRRILNAEVAVPDLDDATCVGGCPCAMEKQQAPWILYRCGDVPISLIIVEDATTRVPRSSHRSRHGRPYHAFQIGANTVLVCRAEKVVHLWISRLPEDHLVECVMETREGREAFAGERISIRGVTCRACCALAEARARKVTGVTGAKVDLKSMEMIVAGRENLDLDRIIHELREAGLDVRAK